MQFLGDFTPGKQVLCLFNSRNATGLPTTLTASPAVVVYKNSLTESAVGVSLSVDYDGRTGLNQVLIDTSADAAFYSSGSDFAIVVSSGSVGTINVAGSIVGAFSIANRSALRPTTADRTLDVSSGSEAAINWARIGNPTTTQALTGTTISASQVIASVTGAVASVTATVAANLTQILGTALTETAGLLAGGFKKWLNVAAPTGTLNSLPDAVPGAGGGLLLDDVWTDARAAKLDNLSGDAFVRLGAPAGASVSADIAAAKAVVDAVKAKTDNLPSDPADASDIATATSAIFSRLGAPVGASVSADIAAVQADTDNIQTRIPAALDSGNMKASVQTMATDSVSAAAVSDAAVTKITSGVALQATAAATLADTANIKTRLPATLNPGGAIEASIHDIQDEVIKAASFESDAINANALAADAVAEIQSGLATSSAVAAVQSDTDNIQTRIPAALTGGKMESNIGSVTAGVIAAASFAANALDAVWSAAARTLTAASDSSGITTLLSRIGAAITISSGRVNADVVALNGVTASAANLERSASTIIRGAAVAGTLSTTQMTSNVTGYDTDGLNGRVIIWTSGVLINEATNITAYDGATGKFTFTAVTQAMSAADTFVVV